jgi:translation initiation factor 1 (eIF-1/SUI1)
MQHSDAQGLSEVYFEFTAIGSAVRVAAIDAASGTEVVIVGPSNASAADLERVATAKLKARLAADAG